MGRLVAVTTTTTMIMTMIYNFEMLNSCEKYTCDHSLLILLLHFPSVLLSFVLAWVLCVWVCVCVSIIAHARWWQGLGAFSKTATLTSSQTTSPLHGFDVSLQSATALAKVVDHMGKLYVISVMC